MEPVGTSVRRLGRYHLGEPLGGGPTGEVFRAKVYGVAGFEREFALKRFHRQLLSRDGAREQLAAAARHYAALDHPRIARLDEHDLERADAFVAVEWVAGLDVTQLIDSTFGQGQPLPAGAVTALISRAARAVGYAHGRGLAHLGLCPTNLICTRAGDIKVTDFGFLPPRLGPRPEGDETLAARIGYLAPEQLSGRTTSPATDVFALGAITFELLTGRRAFSGRTASDVAAAVRGPPPVTDAIPKPLARILDRCFSASPFARYPGGGALADAIDAAARSMLMRGDQRDAARSVAGALDRLAAVRAEKVSGALSFPIPRPPAEAPPSSPESSAFSVPNLELDDVVDDEIITNVRPTPTPASALPPPIAPPTLGAKQPRARSAPPPIPSRRQTLSGPALGAHAHAHTHTHEPAPAPAPEPAPAYTPAPTPAHAHDLAPDPSPPTLPSDLLISVDSSPSLPPAPGPEPAITEPFVRAEPEPDFELELERRRPSTFGESYLRHAQPMSIGQKLMAALGLLALGAIGFFGYLIFFAERPHAGAGAAADAHTTAAVVADAGPPPPDAPPPDAPIPDTLTITSTPEGATVYIDGTKVGKTPVTLDGTPDRHKLALILPGHELHVAEIPGGGDIAVELSEVTPSAGRAGIKVRCRSKNRYYVFIDGRHTGMLCPTERIGVTKEDHVVEIYDPITDTRSRFDVEITQIARSTRVRVD